MRARRFRLFVVAAVIFALVFSLGGVVAAAPGENQGKGPPEISKVVFIHYPKGVPAKGGIPGPPGGKEENGDKLWYKYSGIHWASSDLPVGYRVNLAGVTGSDKTAFLAGIKAGFTTWDNASDPYAVSYSGATSLVPGNLEATWDEDEGKYVEAENVVGWKNVGTKAIGVTYIWYYTLSKELIEVDTALNSNSAFTWWQTSVSGNPDNARWPNGQKSSAYDVDVQNIMTHEAGHWLLLEDLYPKPAGKQTMYGISPEFDLQKRSLESGDEAGIQEIYPGT